MDLITLTMSIVLIVLLAVIDVGCNGRISDGGVFMNSTLSTALEPNAPNIPPPNPLPGKTPIYDSC